MGVVDELNSPWKVPRAAPGSGNYYKYVRTSAVANKTGFSSQSDGRAQVPERSVSSILSMRRLVWLACAVVAVSRPTDQVAKPDVVLGFAGREGDAGRLNNPLAVARGTVLVGLRHMQSRAVFYKEYRREAVLIRTADVENGLPLAIDAPRPLWVAATAYWGRSTQGEYAREVNVVESKCRHKVFNKQRRGRDAHDHRTRRPLMMRIATRKDSSSVHAPLSRYARRCRAARTSGVCACGVWRRPRRAGGMRRTACCIT